MLTAQVVLPGLSSSVPTARHFVESLLTAWGLPDVAWTAALVVSELTANCALHARTEFSVRVTKQSDDQVRLEVADASVRVPQQRTYSSDATTGRGLRLVAQLSSDWGVDVGATGKTVWAVLGVDDPATSDTADDLLAAYPDDDGV